MNRWTRFVPSRRWLILPPIAIGVGVVALLAASRQELPRIEVVEEALPIQVMRVSRHWVRPEVTGYGTAIANRQWNAISEVGGRLTAIHSDLESGSSVRKDELLVEIDRADYQLRLDQRRADLQQAQSQLAQLRLNQQADEESLAIQQNLLDVRTSDGERLSVLSRRSAASQSELDAAKLNLLQQQQSVQTLSGTLSTYPARIDSAKATILTAEARVSEAQRDLQRTRIVAPFDGLIQNVRLEPGQYVAPGQSLFEIIDTSSVEIETHISTAQLSRLAIGLSQRTEPVTSTSEHDPLTRSASASMADQFIGDDENRSLLSSLTARVVTRNNLLNGEFSGKPVRLSSSIDSRTRTLGVIIRVDNPTLPSGLVDATASQLRAGSYCEVFLHNEEPIHAFRIPRVAVEDSTVLTIDAENRLRRKTVSIAFNQNGNAVISDGLRDGERVVLNPPTIALEGQLVDPIELDETIQAMP